jgi:hypothetical protein
MRRRRLPFTKEAVLLLRASEVGTMAQASAPGYRVLRSAAVLYAAGTLIHTADHFRRGSDTVTTHVYSIGTVGTVLAFVTIGLVLAGHRLAPAAAVAVGLAHGFGIAAVHLLPDWGVFSDAFTGSAVARGVTGLSWAAVLLEVAGALATGFAGLYVLRSGRARTAAAT